MTGAEMIAAERQRQIDEEGWTDSHDDRYVEGELLRASVYYIAHINESSDQPPLVHSTWPWSQNWYKPVDPVRDLVKAGALIAAEIDRLKRNEP